MNKICTSLKQSKKLIKLGIDINTADMHYSTWTMLNKKKYVLYPNQGETIIEKLHKAYVNQVIPAWSLTALLKMLPLPTLEETMITTTETKWQCTIYCESYAKYYSELHNDAIDAAFEMVIWLKEKNLL